MRLESLACGVDYFSDVLAPYEHRQCELGIPPGRVAEKLIQSRWLLTASARKARRAAPPLALVNKNVAILDANYYVRLAALVEGLACSLTL